MYIEELMLYAILNLKAHPQLSTEIWVISYICVIYEYDKPRRPVALCEQ